MHNMISVLAISHDEMQTVRYWPEIQYPASQLQNYYIHVLIGVLFLFLIKSVNLVKLCMHIDIGNGSP